ncbi:hypothetical protein JCM4814A_07320 [Streptomyces phaeofaciens JCM 4814]|uniref:Uncharacterized protein n=1 Tax=Streptomyces phaeofaciens TaxID=68254 RepID=A0A918HI16_9ACTN|nr:hypothetical protein GCM10010226_49220 [Streptomyces phaeofaciens]
MPAADTTHTRVRAEWARARAAADPAEADELRRRREDLRTEYAGIMRSMA